MRACGADAAHKAVGELRLDDVAQLAIPAGEDKVALEGRRPDVDGGLDIDAVERIVADGGDAVAQIGQIGDLADGVGGVAESALQERRSSRRRRRAWKDEDRSRCGPRCGRGNGAQSG